MRVIAGRFGGRTLVAPAGAATRPTADRVREALFSVLADVHGEAVLDLYAGTGALGIEALSRGAAHATFVEKDRRAATAIDALAREWHEEAVTVEAGDALAWLGRAQGTQFDIVFLDPPYDAQLLASAAAALAARSLLAADARIYVEHRAREPLAALPAGWQNIRDGRAGEVGYHLFGT